MFKMKSLTFKRKEECKQLQIEPSKAPGEVMWVGVIVPGKKHFAEICTGLSGKAGESAVTQEETLTVLRSGGPSYR